LNRYKDSANINREHPLKFGEWVVIDDPAAWCARKVPSSPFAVHENGMRLASIPFGSEARGKARVIEDEGWPRSQIGQLTDEQEQGHVHPWRVSDAPTAFLEGQLRAIVGVKIPITRLEGKWKVSQNRSGADRQSVAMGLSESGNEGMAELVTNGCSFKT
jgi:hypothetical protein